MNTLSMGTFKPFQTLHPLSLLAQLTSREASGCLQVSNGTDSWLLYLEQGKLLYASNSIDPFGRLDRHLRRFSIQAPSLVSAVRVQLRLLFETSAEEQPLAGRDYEAICWLVEQQHLRPEQAAALIEGLASEVLESFLLLQNGSSELIEQPVFPDLPKLCHLDLRTLAEDCQNHLQRRQSAKPLASTPIERYNLVQRNGNYTKPEDEKPATDKPQPATQDAPRATGAIQTAAKVGQPALPTHKTNYTIACIDDSPTVLQAINAFLDDKSFSIVLISDPVKALMQIIRSKPDLILLDVTMPSLDGYELCSLLRKHPSFRNTPIIMVTGNTGFIDRAKAKLVGASGYLTKPFTQSDLIKMVFKHLV